MSSRVVEPHFNHSGGVQAGVNRFLRAANEVEDVTNARFNKLIGRIIRRSGYVVLESLQSGKSGLGLFEARFSTGSKLFSAINNSGDTATNVKTRDNDTEAWSSLTMPTTLGANTEINMCTSLDEAYIAGKVIDGDRIAPVNVQNDLSLSETRNLIGVPKARFVCEYGGRLYAINVEVDSVVYADRAYQSSPALSVITYTRGAQNTLADGKIGVDSVRYLKDGMAIDIYNHLTDTVKYSNVTISSVDKATDAIVLPARSGNLTFTAAATDIITVSSTTNYTTGTPVTVTTTGTLPAGLATETIYYVINVSSTTIKLATTAANATAGTAIDITSTGSGTHTLNLSYVVDDNDEIYLTGRHGELCYLWNTDYPSVDRADFLKLPSGASSNSEIVGYGKSNNRLFLFTDETAHRWDQSQLVPLFEDIGCASHQTICNIADWLIWLDDEGRVQAYNDKTGQHEFISKAIHEEYMLDLTSTNFAAASAGSLGNMYYLSLGTIDDENIRVVYDFDSNNWSRDKLPHNFTRYVVSKFDGKRKLYAIGDDGNFLRDNEGNLDGTEIIPLIVRFGRGHSGTSLDKLYQGYYIFGENMNGGEVRCYTNGNTNKPYDLGKLTDNISVVEIGKDVHGRDINLEISITGKGDPPAIDGYEMFAVTQEDKFGGK
jgi:hypothetical protein